MVKYRGGRYGKVALGASMAAGAASIYAGKYLKKGPRALRGARRYAAPAAKRVAPSMGSKLMSLPKYKLNSSLQRGSGQRTVMKYNYPIKGRVSGLSAKLPQQVYVRNDSENFRGGVGNQDVNYSSLFNNVDLSAIFSMVTPTEAATDGSLTRQAFLQSGNMEFLITNANNSGVFMDIYDITLKRDIGSGVWETANVADPVTAFSAGMIAQGAPSGANILNTSPFNSKYFTSFYNIKKISHHYLIGGETHRHSVTANVNRLIDRPHDLATTSIRGLTHHTMFVAWGQPVNDDAGVISSAPISLNVIRTTRYNFKWIERNYSTTVLGNNLVATLTQQKFIDVVDGAADTVVDVNPLT